MLVVAKAVTGPGAILNTAVDRPEITGEIGGIWVARGRNKSDVGVKLGEWRNNQACHVSGVLVRSAAAPCGVEV